MMSGGPIEKFTEGWAVKIFGFGKGHYYKRDGAGLAYPVCGGDGVPSAQLRGIGTWKLCQRCEKFTGAGIARDPQSLPGHSTAASAVTTIPQLESKLKPGGKAVKDFTRVCREEGLDLDYGREEK